MVLIFISRNYSLDEIPQFFNVLRGDMSLVGPRPLFDEDTAKFNANYMRRLERYARDYRTTSNK